MNITGMQYGARLLQFADFPTAEILGPDASEEQIKALIERHGSVFVKPVFKGGVGKKGKAGLIGRARDLRTALAEKERLYFVEHRHGNQVAKANGVTFEGAVPAEHEVYFSITDSTEFRAPTMTLTHMGITLPAATTSTPSTSRSRWASPTTPSNNTEREAAGLRRMFSFMVLPPLEREGREGRSLFIRS